MLTMPAWVKKSLTKDQLKKLKFHSNRGNNNRRFMFFMVKEPMIVHKKVVDGRKRPVISLILMKNTLICINNFSNKFKLTVV